MELDGQKKVTVDVKVNVGQHSLDKNYGDGPSLRRRHRDSLMALYQCPWPSSGHGHRLCGRTRLKSAAQNKRPIKSQSLGTKKALYNDIPSAYPLGSGEINLPNFGEYILGMKKYNPVSPSSLEEVKPLS